MKPMVLQKALVALGLWPEAAKVLSADAILTLPTVAAGASLTMTTAHADKVILLDQATGSTVVLPAATGTGNVYRFKVSTAVTSNNHIIKVANGTDIFRGQLQVNAAPAINATPIATGDTITMNGTTTGGLVGTYIDVFDWQAGYFIVSGFTTGSGTGATPFTATVS